MEQVAKDGFALPWSHGLSMRRAARLQGSRVAPLGCGLIRRPGRTIRLSPGLKRSGRPKPALLRGGEPHTFVRAGDAATGGRTRSCGTSRGKSIIDVMPRGFSRVRPMRLAGSMATSNTVAPATPPTSSAWPTRWRGGVRLFDLICRRFNRDCGWNRRRDSYTVTIIAPSSRSMIGPI
jgi:hypothetical protein